MYLHVPGNEIGIVGQFWTNPAYHIKLEPNRDKHCKTILLLLTSSKIGTNRIVILLVQFV